MSLTLRVPTMTREQFFDWASAQGGRYEFDGFEPVAMVGGTLNHNQIALNIHFALRQRLGGTGCRPYGMDAGVATVGDTVRYPDGVVTCSPMNGTSRLVPNPVIVFEVTSEGSYQTDLIVKNRSYRATPSIQRYIIVQQAQKAAIVFMRRDEDWLTEIVSGDNAVLHLPEIGIEVLLDELYRNVELEPLPEDER